jgi:transcriptional regulator with XRE-family HTH domain
MDTIKFLGERIIELRKQNGITREELAKEFEIPYTTLRNYENGLREPGHLFLIKVAKKFGVTTDYLLGMSNEQQPIKKAPTDNLGESDFQKQRLIHNYDNLNQTGKDKLVDYSDDLNDNPKYTDFENVGNQKQA